MTHFPARLLALLAHADVYHDAYYRSEPFGGPSLYFHRQALATRASPTDLQHLEYVYATLVSWGMHRMGKGGSKMLSFQAFRASVEPLRDCIALAQRLTPAAFDDAGWALLEGIFRGIKVMASGATLVGNSKVMHHLLPNVVPPIDREYTLRLLYGNTNLPNDLGKEWARMREIISGFFIPAAANPTLEAKARQWMADESRYPWDTSVMKVIDNLLVGARKHALSSSASELSS